MAESYEREVRDLPWSEYKTTVVIELYQVRCPDCGARAEKAPLLPSKAPFGKRFEDAVGQACESAAASPVAKQFGLAASTVRAIDFRYLGRWSAKRRKPAPRKMGVDEIFLGKQQAVPGREIQRGFLQWNLAPCSSSWVTLRKRNARPAQATAIREHQRKMSIKESSMAC